MSSLYEINVATASGQSRNMSDYKGDVLLIVNVAWAPTAVEIPSQKWIFRSLA